ncbi:MAG: hypothetical protein KJ995_04125 [Candidatus Omnitrophica bacterium]|nr:hypothetical protein [Candidatus Omnitrophota bacterium]MBU1128569.1 hypothetical protein [Candidatus Omnitrophota bacterium]MBU1851573.1 hypothetical protein [Candidatus Omnitrophota bacterium]
MEKLIDQNSPHQSFYTPFFFLLKGVKEIHPVDFFRNLSAGVHALTLFLSKGVKIAKTL